ncbi:hypothetical protein [Pseudomonas sp. dw_612]|uniref:hypothetical protein n=1 Tax=Pseudomonas sp. dw_612 TaxID=2720080 RepID=UPI003209B27C
MDEKGRIDKTFADKGFTFGQFRPPFNASGGKVAVHGKWIYMLGYTYLDADSDFPPEHLTITRFTEQGVLDSDFAAGGHLILPNLAIEQLITDSSCLAIQPDGKIVISATYHAPGNERRLSGVLYRINPDGTLDNSFNTTGRLNVMLNGGADITSVNEMQLQGDKILIVGGVRQIDGEKGYFARYNNNGTVDMTFGEAATPGVYVLNLADTTLNALIQTTDDRFVGLGKSGIDRDEEGLLIPIKGLLLGMNADGRPDQHFNRGQPVLTSLNEQLGDNWHAGFMDADRRLTVASVHGSVHFARFLDNGLLDTHFGTDGKVDEDTDANAKPVFLQRRLEKRFVFGGNTSGISSFLGVLWAYWS